MRPRGLPWDEDRDRGPPDTDERGEHREDREGVLSRRRGSGAIDMRRTIRHVRGMDEALAARADGILAELESSGLTKIERPLDGPQGGHIAVAEQGGRREPVNLCANNYLGLADHPDIIAAAHAALDR